MADVKWIKIATNIFDNRKIKQIENIPQGDGIIAIWLKILCLAGTVNDCGMIYITRDIPYTDQTLATEFNRPLLLVQLALSTFQRFGMIEVVNDFICISNWEKYQSTDRMLEIREYNRVAQQKSREKRKLLNSVNDSSMTSQSCHDTDIDKDIDKEVDKEKEKNTPAPRHFVGQHGYVKLTDKELDRLIQDLGQSETDRVIAYVDESAAATRNKNEWKDWNLVLRKASREGWGKRDKAKADQSKTRYFYRDEEGNPQEGWR